MKTAYYKYLDINMVKGELPPELEAHAITKQSKAAWALLSNCWRNVYGEDLPTVEFLKSGKPIINGGYISIAHSNNMVAVAFSKDAVVGVDIELIKNDYPKRVAELMNYNGEPCGFYSLWTRREAVIKAFDLSSLKRGAEGQFTGYTAVVDGGYALAVYGEDASFIKL